MAGASESWHESEDKLRPETMDMHRALVSIQEELEAVDWYQQRIDACDDPQLAAILEHNRDEEKEHAAMVLEWVRQRDRGLDDELKRYLWNAEALGAEVSGAGGAAAVEASAAPSSDGSLGIGTLKGANP